jgi:hypothetical protein
LLPTFDSGEDPFWIGRPNEGFGVGVSVGDEAVDGELQVYDRLEYAALEPLARELGEEPFDSVEPGCRGRGELERGMSFGSARDASNSRRTRAAVY